MIFTFVNPLNFLVNSSFEFLELNMELLAILFFLGRHDDDGKEKIHGKQKCHKQHEHDIEGAFEIIIEIDFTIEVRCSLILGLKKYIHGKTPLIAAFFE